MPKKRPSVSAVHIRPFKEAGTPVWILWAMPKSAELAALRVLEEMTDGRMAEVTENVYRIDHDYGAVFKAQIRRRFCPICVDHGACPDWKDPALAGFVVRSKTDVKYGEEIDFEAMFDGVGDSIADFLSGFGVPPVELAKAAAEIGVSWPATLEQVDVAFKKAVQERHPDREGGSTERMKAANNARDILVKKLKGAAA